MAKKVFYDEDARCCVLGGAEVLYNAVKTTMGPKGRNVVVGKTYGELYPSSLWSVKGRCRRRIIS